MAFEFTFLACGFQFLIALLEKRVLAAGEAVSGGDVTERAVQAGLIVMVDEGAGDSLGVLQVQGGLGPDGLLLEGAVEAFDFSVALRVVRRGQNVGGLEVSNEGFEVLGDELGTVVGDDPRTEPGISFVGLLQDSRAQRDVDGQAATISASASFIAGRMSQERMLREQPSSTEHR